MAIEGESPVTDEDAGTDNGGMGNVVTAGLWGLPGDPITAVAAGALAAAIASVWTRLRRRP